MTYGSVDKADNLGYAGNTTNRFLNGTVINSGPEAVIEIRNPFLGTKIRLDMSDRRHPRRAAEDGT